MVRRGPGGGTADGALTMFKLFKRAEPPAPPARKRSPETARPPRRAPPAIQDPLPVPEVVETADESAWDEWEQSNYQLDSQLGGLSPSDSVKVRGTDGAASRPQELDPFARIGKNHR